jgi:hypothetical protein
MNAQWDALVRYAADGILEIDNLTAERALRGIAVGRNYVQPSVMCSSPMPRGRGRQYSGFWPVGELHIIHRFCRNRIN